MLARTFVMVGVLASCEPSTRLPPKTPVARRPVATPVVKTPSAALLAAPRLVGRRFTSGMVPPSKLHPYGHTTFTLQREGGQALLTIEARGHADPDHWKVISTKQYVGTANENGDVLDLSVAHGSEAIVLACTRKTLSAAAATAMRRPAGGSNGDCGSQGLWTSKAVAPIEVWHCTPDVDDWAQLAFAAAPGIEWVHVNDDCVMQGGGWRLVPEDGSVAPARVAP